MNGFKILIVGLPLFVMMGMTSQVMAEGPAEDLSHVEGQYQLVSAVVNDDGTETLSFRLILNNQPGFALESASLSLVSINNLVSFDDTDTSQVTLDSYAYTPWQITTWYQGQFVLGIPLIFYGAAYNSTGASVSVSATLYYDEPN